MTALRSRTLVARSLTHFARSHLALLLACAVSCAVVCGALVVGDSVRGSLRQRALERLGRLEWAIVSTRFFREDLARDLERELARDRALAGACGRPAPVMALLGSVENAARGRRAVRVNVFGVDERFNGVSPGLPANALGGRSAALSAPLARELGAEVGDNLLVRFEASNDVAREHALGKRDAVVESLSVATAALLADEGAGLFDLRNQQEAPRNVFVPLGVLQRALGEEGRANALLVPLPPDLRGGPGGGERAAINGLDPMPALERAWRFEDLGLRLARRDARGHLAFESDGFLLSAAASSAGKRAARAAGCACLEVFTYLANGIAHEAAADPTTRPTPRRSSVPYSTVTALGAWTWPDGRTEAPLSAVRSDVWRPGGVLLSAWTASEIGARPGDRVHIEYFAAESVHALVERSRSFVVSGVVPLEGEAADPDWTPHFEGVSDARTFRDWDAPFEIDHTRIRPQDEAYWNEHRTTPKAFLELADGQELWSSRFGDLTALRVRPLPETPLGAAEEAFASALRRELALDDFDLKLRPLRRDALESAAAGTDFGVLFLAMSVFLIAAALLLAAMTLSLALGRRAPQLGILSALGFSPVSRKRLVLTEALAVGAAGTVAGVGAGLGYALLLIAGLKSEAWWGKAVQAPFLALHVEPQSIVLGAATSLVLFAAVVELALRRLGRLSPRQLLGGGSILDARSGRARGRWSLVAGVACLVVAGSALAGALLDAVALVAAFFALGASVLGAGLAFLAWLLRAARKPSSGAGGLRSLVRLGAANAHRFPGRSLVTVSLIASATFLVVVVAASHQVPGSGPPERDSPDGGFTFLATSAVPLFHDLRRDHGQEALSLSAGTRDILRSERTEVHAFRVRPGDETSCRNLYRPAEPRILGAAGGFIARGGFRWAASLAATGEERQNPWVLLRRSLPDGAVPAVGDQSTVQWILHSGLGKEILVDGGRLRLRIVGLLAHSVFQGELVIAEDAFSRCFPHHDGWSAFLIACPEERAGELEGALESDLGAYGFDARRTADVLRSYQEVENTYLATFLVLGGLGLLLGTLGLGAVVLRSVLERQGEVALLLALGFTRAATAWLVLGEALALLASGVLLGASAALLATLPNVARSLQEISWTLLGATVALVLLAGVLSSALAVRSTLKVPPIAALRRE
jgi:ABC-type lipoprotein release transport system permease subunit